MNILARKWHSETPSKTLNLEPFLEKDWEYTLEKHYVEFLKVFIDQQVNPATKNDSNLRNTHKSPAQTKRMELRTLIRRYFSECSTKFFSMNEIHEFFIQNLQFNEHFDLLKTRICFVELEKFTINLLVFPWKTEYSAVPKDNIGFLDNWDNPLRNRTIFLKLLGFEESDYWYNLDEKKTRTGFVKIAMNCWIAIELLTTCNDAIIRVGKEIMFDAKVNAVEIIQILIDCNFKEDAAVDAISKKYALFNRSFDKQY